MTGIFKKVDKNLSAETTFFFARYHVMSTCWQGDPVSRPEFLHLRNTWLEFIEKEVMINMYLKIKVTI